jgi:hypothetical protein
MGQLRDSGSSRVTLSSHVPATGTDELLEAVRQTAGEEYEVFGEIGRSPEKVIAYLARDRQDKKLVALRLTRSRSNEYELEVAKHLDASVPAPGAVCPRCGTRLRSWGRFCTNCGLDMWTGPSIADAGSPERVLEAVKEAMAGKFEVLGEMTRGQGGDTVYFARDIATGRIEALRLRKETDRDFSLGMTNVLQRALSDAPQPEPRRRPK